MKIVELLSPGISETRERDSVLFRDDLPGICEEEGSPRRSKEEAVGSAYQSLFGGPSESAATVIVTASTGAGRDRAASDPFIAEDKHTAAAQEEGEHKISTKPLEKPYSPEKQENNRKEEEQVFDTNQTICQ